MTTSPTKPAKVTIQSSQKKKKGPPDQKEAEAEGKPASGFDALLADYNSEEDDDFDPDGGGDDEDVNMDSGSEDEGGEDEDGEDEDGEDEGGESEEEDVIGEVEKILPTVAEEVVEGKGKMKSVGRRQRELSFNDGRSDSEKRRPNTVWSSSNKNGKLKVQKVVEEEEADEDENDEDFEDSGDDEGAGAGYKSIQSEGGLIKTRAQRAREQKEKIPLASTANATANVDSLWESMNQPTWRRKSETLSSHPETATTTPITTKTGTTTTPTISQDGTPSTSTTTPLSESNSNQPDTGPSMILIKRTYEFAGETHTEEKLVPKTSYEAKVYLQSLQSPSDLTSNFTSDLTGGTDKKPALRRPLKRTSAFDTFNPPPKPGKAAKLNTLEKSRMDWAGYVDKEEGLAEDLDRYSKSAKGYVQKQEFLGRVEGRRGEAWKEGAGKAARK